MYIAVTYSRLNRESDNFFASTISTSQELPTRDIISGSSIHPPLFLLTSVKESGNRLLRMVRINIVTPMLVANIIHTDNYI